MHIGSMHKFTELILRTLVSYKGSTIIRLMEREDIRMAIPSQDYINLGISQCIEEELDRLRFLKWCRRDSTLWIDNKPIYIYVITELGIANLMHHWNHQRFDQRQ